ncbi:hypothetical protein HW932_19105 [Allochromatium humboldtianum]|uniref:Uncharacterized protein n=1 Tax=Allochromatium humboldtianum TaxID=504901 RepID=A0A850RJT0_9GAMM|nr:hypothetical protein [Allochromatium humboldtianum]NVZ11362.1 hypothetical protein [Allochromatium humboldtianum]
MTTTTTKPKAKTTAPKTPTAAERLEQATQHAREAKAALEAAWIADKPTADLRTAHQAALDAMGEAKAALEAERRAEAEAARQAEQQRIAPMVEQMVGEVLEPLKVRIEQGFSIDAPGLPEVYTEWAVKSIHARERLEVIEQAMQESSTRVAELDSRIEKLKADRVALIARRAQGDTREDDAAQLALIDADTEALVSLAREARTEAEQVARELESARKAAETASAGWENERRRAMAEFFEQAARRVESLLGDCFTEQQKGRRGSLHAPMFWDDRVRAVARMKPLDMGEAA